MEKQLRELGAARVDGDGGQPGPEENMNPCTSRRVHPLQHVGGNKTHTERVIIMHILDECASTESWALV